MSGEWNAWLTFRRRLLTPSAFIDAVISSTAAAPPATTVARGPFTAAMSTTSVHSATYGATSASDARKDTIAPVRGRACMRQARAATNAQASARSNTPATCAAAISPIE